MECGEAFVSTPSWISYHVSMKFLQQYFFLNDTEQKDIAVK